MMYKKIITTLITSSLLLSAVSVTPVHAETIQTNNPAQSSELTRNPLADADAMLQKENEESQEYVKEQKRINDRKNSCISSLASLNSQTKNIYDKAAEQAANFPDYAPANEKLQKMQDIWDQEKKLNLAACNYKTILVTGGIDLEIANAKITSLEGIVGKMQSLKDEAESIDLNVDKYNGYYDLSDARKQMVENAISLIGKIPYSWGEKPAGPGWNEKWNNGQIGLDCSGFIQWDYWTTFGDYKEDLGSTLAITHTYTEISEDDLLPGDIGTIITDGSYYLDQFGNKYYSEANAENGSLAAGGDGSYKTVTNHVGIYIGKDENGNMLWCHCKGNPENTVVVTSETEFNKFTHFYRIVSPENES